MTSQLHIWTDPEASQEMDRADRTPKAKIISIADYAHRRSTSPSQKPSTANIIHVRFTPHRRPLPPTA